MAPTFGQDLIASLREALDHARGLETGAREHVIEAPDAPDVPSPPAGEGGGEADG